MYSALSNGALRMVNTGITRFGGRLELYYNYKWGTVCDDGWSVTDAAVACRQLGFVSVSDRTEYFDSGMSSQPIWLDDVDCKGPESRLIDCSHAGIGQNDCAHSEDVGFVCTNGKLVYSKTLSCHAILIHKDQKYIFYTIFILDYIIYTIYYYI